MIMPFGDFINQDLEDIPSGYLKWLSENCHNEDIAIAAGEEYEYREKWNKHFWD